ncbi:MAG TPA: sugar transferase [Thermoanaerobaculia bacterium]|nr:sugar transferase [Thermoanaerobaculia bacterium]
MLKQQARLVAGLVILADLALVSGAFLAAHAVRSHFAPAIGLGERSPGLYPLDRYLPLLPLALAIWGILLWSTGRYRSHRRVPLLEEASALVRVNLLAAAAFALSVWFFRLDERLLGSDRISRSWIALFALISFLALAAEKLALRLAARRIRERGLNFRTIVIVGTGPTAGSIAEAILDHRWWGYRLLGVLAAEDAAEPVDPRAGPLLGCARDLERLMADNVIDEVVFAVPPRDVARFENLVFTLQDQGILVRFALDLLPHSRTRVELEELEGVPFLSFSTSPSGVLPLAFKRAMDLALSFVLLALALPVIFLVALTIKLSAGGAVLFRQRRCGLNGRVFTLYKFRTMDADAEGRRIEVEHLNEMGGPVFKARNDPRVTRLGRVLRKFSLDELPQLWNVLRGDMSLVGPRPPIPDEVARYERWQRRRLAMKPGLTGLWQVSGRNEVDFERWMALDLQYIDNWSPWLDLKILARTVPVVLSGRGAS